MCQNDPVPLILVSYLSFSLYDYTIIHNTVAILFNSNFNCTNLKNVKLVDIAFPDINFFFFFGYIHHFSDATILTIITGRLFGDIFGKCFWV